ncbi:MAG: hypothetical protein IPK81_23375 [Rhodospirillales bacterium]|nr:MAG: hypothetical protein IPK81_23375 [Rhodospirillales bacterium]
MTDPKRVDAHTRARRRHRYTTALGVTVCRRLAAGESVYALDRDPAMPCASSIMRWRRDYAEFADMYAQSVLARADRYAGAAFAEAQETARRAGEARAELQRERDRLGAVALRRAREIVAATPAGIAGTRRAARSAESEVARAERLRAALGEPGGAAKT